MSGANISRALEAAASPLFQMRIEMLPTSAALTCLLRWTTWRSNQKFLAATGGRPADVGRIREFLQPSLDGSVRVMHPVERFATSLIPERNVPHEILFASARYDR